VKALLTPRGLLAAGSAYALLYVGVTSLVPPPASPQARLLLADLLLMVPALVALASTAGAARRSLGVERSFWSLLAGATAVQVLNGTFYGLHVALPDNPWFPAIAYGAYHAFFALVGASLLVWPHRQLSADRVRGATLDWLMGAAALGFFIGSFVALPNGDRATRWLWTYTIQETLVGAGYLVLALTTREQPFRRVYGLLAGGFLASALVDVVPYSLQPFGARDLYHPVHVDWVLSLFAMAAAGRAPRAVSWMRAADEAEPDRLRPWLAAAAVPLPLLADLGLRAAGFQPHFAGARTGIAVAFGALLAVLAVLRAYGSRPGPALAASLRQTSDAAGDSSQYLQFASGIAHELNNPLTVVAGWAELGLKRAAPRLPLEQLLDASRKAAGVVARLQRLSHAAGGPSPSEGAGESADSGPQGDTGTLLPEPHVHREALVGFGMFAAALVAVQHGARAIGAGPWWGDAAVALPAAAAGVLLLRRGGASRTPRRRGFWHLLAAGALLWSAATVAWAVLRFRGVDPAQVSVPALDILFLGFLVPVLGALALRPHRPAPRLDLVAASDAVILALTISFLFVRVVVLPLGGAPDRTWNQAALLGTLAWVAALWAGVLWRTIPQPGWRRVYGLLALFAITYGVFSAVVNGYGRGMAGGSLADLAWMAPFLFLALAALRHPRGGAERADGGPRWAVAIGLGIYVTEALARAAWPGRTVAGADALLIATTCLAALAYGARLWAGETTAHRQEAEARRQAEEVRRAGRLGALAALAAATVAELRDVLEDVARLAVHASKALPGQGRHVVAQAERAREIARELAESFRLAPVGPRHPVDLGGLVEHTVQGALDQGLGLHVRVEGLAGLPRVWGDPAALSAAVHHLLRNAAQASPGGVLRISGAVDDRWVVVRLSDDGPGVAPAIRSRVFDPFFTTRRVGEGLGLGLTLVHFVARSHGGAVFLDDTRPGGCFVVRLPAYEAPSLEAVRTTWPWAAAALVSAALATGLAVIRPGPGRAVASIALQLAAPLLAAALLSWVAIRRAGAARAFWGFLAAGPALWTVSRILRVWDTGWDWQGLPGVLPMILFALGDLAWPAALLVRPDRPPRATRRFDFGAGAVLCVFAYAHLNLMVFPDPVVLADPALRFQLAALRAVQRASLIVWAAVLAWQAWSPAWRRRYGRLAVVFGVFTVGYTLAFQARGLPGYQAGALSDLGWILPLLCLAAVAWREAVAEEEAPDAAEAAQGHVAPSGSAAWLVTLAAIVMMDMVLGPSSGPPGLDAARSAITRIMVIAMAGILAARELAGDGGRSAWRRWPREVTSGRLLKVVSAALHELGGHVSGTAALGRLLQAQLDASPRGKADAQRIVDRGDAAGRIIRNLLEALPQQSLGEPVRLDGLLRDVVESRRESLEAGRVDVTLGPCPDVPEVFAHRGALQHALTALLDHAAAAHGCRVELSTSVSGEHPLVSVVVGGAKGAPAPADQALDLVREILAREGAELSIRSRAVGITEYVVRFDHAPGQERRRPAAWPGASAAS
jgi:signal transduction histidine kinase